MSDLAELRAALAAIHAEAHHTEPEWYRVASEAQRALSTLARIEAGRVEGWQLVPNEPTEEMINAWHMAPLEPRRLRYRAMLAAAPPPPATPEQEGQS